VRFIRKFFFGFYRILLMIFQWNSTRDRFATFDGYEEGGDPGWLEGAVDCYYKMNNCDSSTNIPLQMGSSCMVVPSVKDVDLATLFPAGVDVKSVPSGKTYLRITPQPWLINVQSINRPIGQHFVRILLDVSNICDCWHFSPLAISTCGILWLW
jgi:hypothetical protein